MALLVVVAVVVSIRVVWVVGATVVRDTSIVMVGLHCWNRDGKKQSMRLRWVSVIGSGDLQHLRQPIEMVNVNQVSGKFRVTNSSPVSWRPPIHWSTTTVIQFSMALPWNDCDYCYTVLVIRKLFVMRLHSTILRRGGVFSMQNTCGFGRWLSSNNYFIIGNLCELKPWPFKWFVSSTARVLDNQLNSFNGIIIDQQ